MRISSLHRKAGLAALVLTLGTAVTACSGDDSDESADSSPSGGESSMTQDESMSGDSATGEEPQGSGGQAMSAGDQTFGPGCASVPKTGKGSFNGMASAPVASAASENPMLTTLVSAVDQAGLVDTLNTAKGVTVFAPTDDAFAEIPKKDMDAVMADKDQLTEILSHHVVEGRLSPDQLAGKHKTLNGDTLVVKGSGEKFMVDDENAAVLCGNIPTANATVYVVDTVLMP